MQMRRGDLLIDYGDDGRGVPLVLVHAFAADRALWEAQVTALSPRYRVIAPDLRGFGGSSGTDGSAVTMDRYADDVLELVDHLGLKRVFIGGISLGGYVALSFALRHGSRTAGLILANTRAGADNPEWASFREALVADVLQRGAVAVVENYGDKPFGPSCPAEAREAVRRMILRQGAEGLASGTRGMAVRPDRRPSLPSITVPTLVIHGTADQYIPASEGLAMHQSIPGSRYVEIAEGGHLSNVDSPDAFNRAVDEFLQPFAAEYDR